MARRSTSALRSDGIIGRHKYLRILLVAPTGSGKTIIASAIVKDFLRRGKRVLVLCHRREIITQTDGKLRELDVWSGIIMAGQSETPLAHVQIASVLTLWSRAMRKGKNGKARMQLPDADLVVVDECHHATTRSWRAILDAYRNAVILGLTATPCRGDGRGLGEIFETLIQCPQVAELIDLGHLVRSRVYAPSAPDLKGVDVSNGDYVESQLADRMDKTELVADIVATWHRYGERRRTVCFATGVGHSIHLRDQFIASGVRAEHIDGSTPKDERDATLERLASGELELVTNCMVLTEGWNMPEVGCCILARPTWKMELYRQMIGRVLRTAPGKTDAIILDHSGAVFRHGLPEDQVDWALDPHRSAISPDHEARKSEMPDGPTLVTCKQCDTLREGGKPCPNCGYMPERRPKFVAVRNGDLALVTGHKPRKPEIDPVTWHAMLTGYADERGYKRGWVAHKFREKFGRWPPSRPITPITPTQEVRSWVRSRNIAWAKAQERGRQ